LQLRPNQPLHLQTLRLSDVFLVVIKNIGVGYISVLLKMLSTSLVLIFVAILSTIEGFPVISNTTETTLENYDHTVSPAVFIENFQDSDWLSDYYDAQDFVETVQNATTIFGLTQTLDFIKSVDADLEEILKNANISSEVKEQAENKTLQVEEKIYGSIFSAEKNSKYYIL
jgi:hypothetical protein